MPRLDGIDVSHFQAQIDHTAVRAAGVDWFAAKATQSTRYVDPTFAGNRTAASAAGFRCVGLYHWLSSTTDPTSQARHFLTTVGALAPGEFAMLDAEEAGITAGECLAWCETVEATTGRPAAVYSGRYVAGGTIWQSTRIREGTVGRRPMIFAAYITEQRARTLAGDYPWSAWQYSSDGPVPGVTGRCDMDQVDDWDVFDVACGNAAHTDIAPAPQPIPSSTEDDMAFIIRNTDSGEVAVIDAGYAVGISAATYTASPLAKMDVTADEWAQFIGVSGTKKAADAALKNGITVTGGSGPSTLQMTGTFTGTAQA